MKDLPSLSDLLRLYPALGKFSWRGRSRSVPYIQQLSASECGAACLGMVLAYFGKAVTLDELRAIAVGARDATNAQALIDTGRLYGLRGRAVSVDIGQLSFLARGAILHWEFTHFVVLDRVSRTAVHVVDPKRGHWRVPLDKFRRSFTGVAIVFEPEADFQTSQDGRKPLWRYVRRLLEEQGFIPHILVTSALLQAFGLGLPLASRLLIDWVVPFRDYSLLLVVGTAMAFVGVLQAATSLVRGHLLAYLRTRLDARLTVGFVDHLLSLPFEFFQRRSAGDLLTRVSSNAAVRDTLTGSLLSALLDGVLAVGYLALLILLSPPLAALSLLLAAIQAALFFITRHRQREFVANGLEAQARSQTYLIDTLSAVETLKALGVEQRAVEHWSGLFAGELNVSIGRGRLEAVVEAMTTLVRTGSSMSLLAIGSVQVMAGRLSLGDMIAAIAVAAGFIGPVVSLLEAATRLQMLLVHLERLDDVFAAKSERDEAGKGMTIRLAGGIGLTSATFRYGPISPVVLDGVSTTIRPNEFVAIVGRSGSGKSTLARLLVGIYEPTAGSISFDDIRMERLNLGALRRQIGVVTQQAQLFGGTIRSNVALADPSLPLERLQRACKLAQIDEDIMSMPMGYDTLLIDRGLSLSGGQLQRLTLARALVTEPRILVLDEATSQLDALTERAVYSQLATLECTRIVIAHRLSTVMTADRILVLERGRIVEEGSHLELIKRGGQYAELVAAQMTDDLSIQ